VLGKLLLAGKRDQSYILNAAIKNQADQLNGRLFMVVEGDKGLIVRQGLVQEDMNALQRSLEAHLVDMGVSVYDICLLDNGPPNEGHIIHYNF